MDIQKNVYARRYQWSIFGVVLYVAAFVHGDASAIVLARANTPCFGHIHRWRSRKSNALLLRVAFSLDSSRGNGWERLYDAMEECWKSDSWTVNPSNASKIDAILRCLNSPAPQSYFVIDHAVKRAQRNNMPLINALQPFEYLLKPGFKLVAPTEKNKMSREMLHWNILPANEIPTDGWQSVSTRCKRIHRTVLEMAYETISIVVDASNNQQSVEESYLCDVAANVLDHLTWTLGTDIRGRSSADAAFLFALAGSRNDDLFLTLALVTRLELVRVGSRNSFRPKFILQIIEKLAAAGLKETDVREIHEEAARCLALKNEHADVVDALTRKGNRFDLLSTRSLLWLWRFSSRLSKAKEIKVAESKLSHYPFKFENQHDCSRRWWETFQDPSRLLVLDLGCGLGVSLLGLASLSPDDQTEFKKSEEAKAIGNIDFAQCNLLGVDLNHLTIGFAQGISERWHLTERLQFAHLAAENVLEEVAAYYPGRVALILIQFPTPFRFHGKVTGNKQLPSLIDNGFMVSPTLLKRVASLLHFSGGRLVIQSNCEDVAVLTRDMAVNRSGMVSMAAPNPMFEEIEVGTGRIPLRTQQWLLLGGERASGNDWSSKSFLPPRAATETEAACLLQGTPIHRCILVADASENEQ